VGVVGSELSAHPPIDRAQTEIRKILMPKSLPRCCLFRTPMAQGRPQASKRLWTVTSGAERVPSGNCRTRRIAGGAEGGMCGWVLAPHHRGPGVAAQAGRAIQESMWVL
jgi:hypothetical protein